MIPYIYFKRVKKGQNQPYLLRVSRHFHRLKRVVKGRHWVKYKHYHPITHYKNKHLFTTYRGNVGNYPF